MQIYPRPEYIFTFRPEEFKIAQKIFPEVKIIRQAFIRGLQPERVFEIFITHLPELYEVYESLIDEESRKTFRGFWLGCITNQISSVVYANTPQYICPGFLPKEGGFVLDCGAYDGATAAHFVDMGCKVYGFEMSKANYERAAKLAEEKNFVVENIGLGSLRYTINYIQDGAGTRIDKNGSESAQITTIDRYVGERNLPRVDFIKMDVEGAEADILRGAATTIMRFKPILALSAYHRLDDFWKLTKLIQSFRPDYEFALRQYATTPEDIADWFSKDLINFLKAFDLEVNIPNYEECVLFAR